jgi:hypothetical protein
MVKRSQVQARVWAEFWQTIHAYVVCPLMIPQIFTRARGPLATSAHEVDTAQVRVLIGCVFIEIVIESETCHICRAIFLTI